MVDVEEERMDVRRVCVCDESWVGRCEARPVGL